MNPVTAVMTLSDQGKFRLEERVKTFLPAFTGERRDGVTIRHRPAAKAVASSVKESGRGRARGPSR
jgi:hypothetical protein